MKLLRRPEPTHRARSRDALAVDVTEPTPDFFDPRRDFPAKELTRLKKLASAPVHQTAELLDDGLNIGWWLKFVDPEFKRLVENQVGFEADLKQAFDSYFTRKKVDQTSSNKFLPNRAVSVIQLFPQLREQMRRKHFDQLLPELLPRGAVESVWQRRVCLVPLLQLYPERRAEIMRVFGVSGADVASVLKEFLLTEQGAGSLGTADLVANTLLLFPEQRSEILAIVSDDQKNKMISYFKGGRQPFEHYIFELGFNLTVIEAEDARIDEAGQIQLQLKSRTALKAPRPLPDRPGV